MEKVVIIGAGPAGLTAGLELLSDGNKNYDVVILEESNAIGGISRTVYHNGNRMDIGGHRFFSKSDEVMNRWKELMPLQGKNPMMIKFLIVKAQYMKMVLTQKMRTGLCLFVIEFQEFTIKSISLIIQFL